MKKRMIMLLCTMSTVALLLSGCGEITETIQSETTTQTSPCSYSLFRTTDVQDYFNFLETFDDTKYEIVDISTSLFKSHGSSEFYIVTYRTITE